MLFCASCAKNEPFCGLWSRQVHLQKDKFVPLFLCIPDQFIGPINSINQTSKRLHLDTDAQVSLLLFAQFMWPNLNNIQKSKLCLFFISSHFRANTNKNYNIVSGDGWCLVFIY